jgi:hypothetical protein
MFSPPERWFQFSWKFQKSMKIRVPYATPSSRP